MVNMTKHANFWTDGPIWVIFSPTLSAGPNYDIETCLVWFGMVKMAKNPNFWANGPIWVISPPTLSAGNWAMDGMVWYGQNG